MGDYADELYRRERAGVSWRKRTQGDADGEVFGRLWPSGTGTWLHDRTMSLLLDWMQAWSNMAAAWLQAHGQAAGPSKLGWATTRAWATVTAR